MIKKILIGAGVLVLAGGGILLKNKMKEDDKRLTRESLENAMVTVNGAIAEINSEAITKANKL